jgi:UDP-glucose:(heptosyl)LPS alpha-1,3-glucosyltransferase
VKINKNKTLRIAVIRQKYTEHGGAERFVDSMLKALCMSQVKIELTLITRKWKNDPNRNFQIIEVNPFYIGRLWRDWSFYKAACRIIKKQKFDIVQSHERLLCADIYRAGEGVHSEWLAQRNRTQPWLSRLFNKISPYHRFILRQEKRVYEAPRLRAIIANSEIVRNQIANNFSKRTAPIYVINNAVDQERYNRELKYASTVRENIGIPEEAFISVFVGSGYERKGVNTLIKIFQVLPKKYHLIIIGKDKNERRFVSTAKKHDLNDRLHFLGPQDDVRPFLAISHLFLFPSLYDPLPNSALEAAAIGLPILASNTTGAAELTEAMGWPAPDPLDIETWRSLIILISETHQELPIEMNRYSAKAMTDRLAQMYREILDEQP